MKKENVFEFIEQEYGFSSDALISTYRGADVVHARHVALFLLMEKCGLSSSEAARLFNRDGSTARSAHTKIKGMVLDGKLNLDVDVSEDVFTKQLQINDILDKAFAGVKLRLTKAFQDDPIGTLCKINEAIK